MRLLVAEDDDMMRQFLTAGLQEAGYAVDAVESGEDAWLATQATPYDVVVLDINLPDLDGFEVCRRIKQSPATAPPVLFLTARETIADRVSGLDLGAEDYLVKPFAFAELLARVRALLRRPAGVPAVLAAGDLTLDPAAQRVTIQSTVVSLSAKEFALLEYLLRNAGRVLTKGMIADHVWSFDLGAESNFIEVLVYAVRKKLELHGGRGVIRTVRGVGYIIDLPAT